MTLDFDNIKNGDHFEELVRTYFEKEKERKNNNISNVEVKKSGVGTDGGRDILVHFWVTDGIDSFKRTWVIQCKFRDKNISPSAINDINLPTLIHSYKASGYLLICRKKPTSKLTELFERLNSECKFDYTYKVWSGDQFIHQLLSSHDSIWQQFFPPYYEYYKQLKSSMD